MRVLPEALTLVRASQSILLATGSIPVVGSSRNTMGGSPIRAMAVLNFLLLPPLFNRHTLYQVFNDALSSAGTTLQTDSHLSGERGLSLSNTEKLLLKYFRSCSLVLSLTNRVACNNITIIIMIIIIIIIIITIYFPVLLSLRAFIILSC